jgi:mannosyltransferase
MSGRLTARVRRIPRPELAAVVLITAFAALLRFASLDARGFWQDEVKTVLLLRRDFVDMLSGVADTEATPHLYYVLAWAWTRVFGDGEVGLRSLSALIGTAMVPVVYVAAARLFSHRIGLVAAALTAVSPLLVWHAQDARSYALFGLTTALALLFFVRAADTSGSRNLIWWALASALAMATHYFALFLVAPMALWLALGRGRDRRRLVAAGAVTVCGALLLPLARYQLRDDPESASAGGGGPEAIEGESIVRRLLQTAAQFLVGPQPDLQRTSAVVVGALVLVAIVLLATRAAQGERRRAAVPLALGAAVILTPVVLTVVGLDYVLARNLLPAWAPLAIVAAAGLGAASAGRTGLAVAGALCLVCTAVVVSTAGEPKFEREDWRGAAAALGSSGDQRAIVVSPDGGADTLLFYRAGARLMPPRGADVREVVVIGLPERRHSLGETPRPPHPDAVPPPPGFVRVGQMREEYFTLVRFRARESRRLSSFSLPGDGLDRTPAVFLEPAG